MWAFDSRTIALIFEPLPQGLALGLPRLLSLPLLLVLGGCVSVGIFSAFDRLFCRHLNKLLNAEYARDRAPAIKRACWPVLWRSMAFSGSPIPPWGLSVA